MTSLTEAVAGIASLSARLAEHIETASKEEKRLRNEISALTAIVNMVEAGIDHEKVALAETIITVRGLYSSAGDDRKSVISDAVKQLATGDPIRPNYGDLWVVYFGTKNYDRWRGQRCDCQYYCGPRHGSVCFSVGLHDDVRRSKKHADLSPEQIEAAIYYLLNLERIQTARQNATAA